MMDVLIIAVKGGTKKESQFEIIIANTFPTLVIKNYV